jgi:ribulose-5-phosphate 4-epimerase/fuculose-1-phosphate aldolase
MEMPRRSSTVIPDPVNDDREDTPKTKDELRHEALSGVLQVVQFGCLAFGNFSDAGAIGYHGMPMVNETVELAKRNAKVASKIDLLLEVGPYAGLVAAAIPFVAQLLVNHGVFKAEQFANAGVVNPDMLESDMKTQLMRKAMESLREQQEAEQELQRMQAEMAANMNGDANSNAE